MGRRSSSTSGRCCARWSKRCRHSRGASSPLPSAWSHRRFCDAVCCDVSMKPTDATALKPLLRGWSHGLAALVSVAGLLALIVVTRNDPAKLVSMIVYGTGLILLFGISGTYHIVNWPPKVKDWLRRADHAMIFVFIAATYTPLVFNVLDGWWRTVVLVAIWICAAAGVAGAAPLLRIPRQLLASLYLEIGRAHV